MNRKTVRIPLLAAVLALTLLAAFGLVATPTPSTDQSGVFTLQAPSFVRVASAEGDAIASVIGSEAGISAYYQSAVPIEFTADFRTVFRTIEAETADYIIGSVRVENYVESEDVHVYVSKNGWMLAYYLKTDPVGKIFDWKTYNGAAINTKLEKTLIRVASFAGVPYTAAAFYDFRYPNATHLMLIGETHEDGNNFTVNLPSSFTYYERSWGLLNDGGASCWQLDGACVTGSTGVGGGYTAQGYLTAAQMLPDATHTIAVDWHGGLALVYRVP